MIIDRPTVAILPNYRTARLTGRHRARFLHAMTTADVNGRAPGEVTFGLMATANGRHLGQMRLEIEADAIVLGARGGTLDTILEGLGRHRVADDVRWAIDDASESSSKRTTLAVHGSSALAVAKAATGLFAGLAPEGFAGRWPWRWEDGDHAELGRLRLSIWGPELSELGSPMVLIRVASDAAPRLRVKLLAAGAEPMDEAGWDRRRVLNGWPADGIDVGSDDVALASERLARTISWTKGCFLGQEVFVMARDRGELPKRLCGLTIEGAEAPAPGELVDGPSGKVLGRLGSVVPLGDGHFGLAMMKRKAAEPGTIVTLTDGRTGRVTALPFGSDKG
jgi:folate-binding Fe-S cluster repair protein YgfZ